MTPAASAVRALTTFEAMAGLTFLPNRRHRHRPRRCEGSPASGISQDKLVCLQVICVPTRNGYCQCCRSWPSDRTGLLTARPLPFADVDVQALRTTLRSQIMTDRSSNIRYGSCTDAFLADVQVYRWSEIAWLERVIHSVSTTSERSEPRWGNRLTALDDQACMAAVGSGRRCIVVVFHQNGMPSAIADQKAMTILDLVRSQLGDGPSRGGAAVGVGVVAEELIAVWA